MKKKHVGYIYKITNDITDEVYIGQTSNNYEERWIQHKRDAKQGVKGTKLVKNFIRFGIENFSFEVVEEVRGFNTFILDIKETEYIRKYDSFKKGLNSNEGPNCNGDSELKYIGSLLEVVSEIIERCSGVDSISFPNNNDNIWLFKAFVLMSNSYMVKDKDILIRVNQTNNAFYIDISKDIQSRIDATMEDFYL